MISEIDAVEEIIAQEKAGAEVEALRAENAALRRELRYRGEQIISSMRRLANAAREDHRGKNEIIMCVIGELLLYTDDRTVFTENMDKDELPF